MNNYIAQISLLVNDYDEAIAFYTQKLGFVLLEDTKLSDTKRWVLVAPTADSQFRLLLAKAVDNQISAVGNQSGGRVFLFLFTDNFEEMYQLLLEQKVTIIRNPEEQAYGKVLVFADLYGNLWDLIEKKINISN